jgi:hypothetical protein
MDGGVGDLTQVTKQPFYSTAEVKRVLELALMRKITDNGYNARMAGFLLRECPGYLVPEWSRWWRDGWRQRSDEDRRRRRVSAKEI